MKKVRLPGGQSIQKAVVPSMTDASDENSFKRGDRKQADARTWYLVDCGVFKDKQARFNAQSSSCDGNLLEQVEG